ncbi:MAG: hypothetical protein LJE68_17330 [Rhodobacter sp.]|nr:hypothetical protein [Rhodobacter sp.]
MGGVVVVVVGVKKGFPSHAAIIITAAKAVIDFCITLLEACLFFLLP